MPRFPPRGLYAITPETLAGEALRAAVHETLLGGAAVVQYRNKSSDPARRAADAGALQKLCAEFGAPLVINDDVDLALRSGAAGVHVGRDDASYADARERLGAEAIVGVSCYDRMELALAAHRDGASYVAFGSFFPSRTKPGAVRVGLELPARARPEIAVPLVGIGGIDAGNAGVLIAAGIDLIAVVEAIFSAPDVRAATVELCALFDERSAPPLTDGSGAADPDRHGERSRE